MSVGQHSMQLHITETINTSQNYKLSLDGENKPENTPIMDQNGQIMNSNEENQQIVHIITSSDIIIFSRV